MTGAPSVRVEVREFRVAELPEAARVLGRGMRDNPLHVRVFGSDPSHREAALSAMFEPLLDQYRSKGAILGAFQDDVLIGVCAMVQPGRCQSTIAEKLQMIPGVVAGNDLGTIADIVRWTSAWGRRDPSDPHWHLGPVAVDRGRQGQGVGSLLLAAFCRRMDESRTAAYLETDKAENVQFYERFGFTTVAQEDVLGVPNWFMLRPPSDPGPAASR